MLKYNQGRFELDCLSFAIPDNTYISAIYEVELEDGFHFISEDGRIHLTMAGNDIAESAIESIESIFDEEDTYRKVGEITELHKARLEGCYVVYEDNTTLHIEACLNTPEIERCHTFTVWAHTDKKYGEEEIARMMRLYTQALDSIQVDVQK